MKGTIVKHESNSTWYVKYTNKQNKNVFWPITPESLLIQRIIPNMTVDFKITEDGKAKIILPNQDTTQQILPEIIDLCEQISNDIDIQSIPISPYPINTQNNTDWTNGFLKALEWIKYQLNN
jgi:membrane-bound lytic murein transglycosylase MltF